LRENLCYCYLLQQPALTRIEDPTAVLRFAWRGKPGYRGKQIPHKAISACALRSMRNR